jgi:hypothetical protein
LQGFSPFQTSQLMARLKTLRISAKLRFACTGACADTAAIVPNVYAGKTHLRTLQRRATEWCLKKAEEMIFGAPNPTLAEPQSMREDPAWKERRATYHRQPARGPHSGKRRR